MNKSKQTMPSIDIPSMLFSPLRVILLNLKSKHLIKQTYLVLPKVIVCDCPVKLPGETLKYQYLESTSDQHKEKASIFISQIQCPLPICNKTQKNPSKIFEKIFFILPQKLIFKQLKYSFLYLYSRLELPVFIYHFMSQGNVSNTYISFYILS